MADGISQNTRESLVSEPDPHGQAALLLVESLIHGLIASAALSVEEAVDVVDTAIEVKADVAVALGESHATMEKSLTLLKAIGASLMHDLPQSQDSSDA